jgi:S1-C subfamily serine protease
METTLTQLSDALAGAVDRVASSTVVIHARARISSSGVVWQPGIIVTADHPIQFDEVHIRLPDGTEKKASIAGRDRATDIAVLGIDGASAVPHFANDTPALKAGNIALAVGRTDQGVTATMGIISTVGGPWRTWRGGLIDRFIRLDMALYAGSSGAAVADANGSVIGIATAGLSRTSAIAIPKSTVDQVVSELLTRGHVARG